MGRVNTNKKKIINDPVYGFIKISFEGLFELIEHPYFQRLRRIKQLGLTYFVYPGATHTRFQHALGSLHLMDMAIEVLRSKGVEITLVVRATNEDYRYTDTDPYLNLQGTTVYDPVAEAVPPYVDPATGYLIDGRHVRRRVFSMSVQIRNNI